MQSGDIVIFSLMF